MESREEFNGIFRTYYKPLYFFARQYVDDADECHDIVADAFEDVLLNYASIESRTIRQYLYTSVRNKCIDRLRHLDIRRQHAEYVRQMGDMYYDPERIVEMKEREAVIQGVLDSLASPTREIFTACYVNHRQYKEVAEAMGTSVNVVKKHIMRALKMIRERKRDER